jgi:hypothetical protein
MGVDKIPCLPTRRSSLTLFSDSMQNDSAVAACAIELTVQTPALVQQTPATRIFPTVVATPCCALEDSKKEAAGRVATETEKESPRSKGQSHFSMVQQPPKSRKPKRSRSFDGNSLVRKTSSPSLPTVHEFQRAIFEHEDVQVLESFRRIRSWGDVLEYRKHSIQNNNDRLSQRSNGKRFSVVSSASSTTGRKWRGTEIIHNGMADLSVHSHKSDYRLSPSPFSNHPTIDIDVDLDDAIIRHKLSQTSQEGRLQATLQTVDEVYKTYHSKYMTAWSQQLDIQNQQVKSIANRKGDTSNTMWHGQFIPKNMTAPHPRHATKAEERKIHASGGDVTASRIVGQRN